MHVFHLLVWWCASLRMCVFVVAYRHNQIQLNEYFLAFLSCIFVQAHMNTYTRIDLRKLCNDIHIFKKHVYVCKFSQGKYENISIWGYMIHKHVCIGSRGLYTYIYLQVETDTYL